MAIELRKYPYPYRAMLSICSDLDETPNQDIYFETARYLNTSEETLLGKGVALEVGNTIYFDMPEHNFSYTNTDDDGRKKIHQLIDSGHIDCLHSFGDFVCERQTIELYWQKIQSGKRPIEVWVDHARAPSNLDNDIMAGFGAIPGAAAYHSDLTVQSGLLAFIWKGRVSSIVAQNVSRSYRGIFNRLNIKDSCKTIALEFIKAWLARLGSVKYAMHKTNKVLRETKLVDGSSVLEFMRCNPSWQGVSSFDTARGIHNILTKTVLDTLVKQQGCSIFYSHLGKVNSKASPFTDDTCQAFELLKKYQTDKQILVTTTRRLLGYLRSKERLTFNCVQNGDETYINVQSGFSLEDLQGLTWYCDNPRLVHMFINGQDITPQLQINPKDYTNRSSLSLAWLPLNFPKL